MNNCSNMKRLLYLIYTLQAFAINAQSLTGVWEGEVVLREGRNTKMSLRLELL